MAPSKVCKSRAARLSNGWIKLGEEDECTLREKFNDEFLSTEDVIWHGLLSHYPLKVIANGAVRILRAKDPSSKANAKPKSRYLKYIGKDKKKHEHATSYATCLTDAE